ncbi:hypothetical protein OS493_026522 [Desmophyllum pertusum]|uniref:Uncharacterized protein n=1 Tax=Desmophyllum pertusum TaxID=174260 RepID=A0A9W9YKW0_9CNID|nr:hypothetical protein OS493_026522 [Desmophyllum pertusum]
MLNIQEVEADSYAHDDVFKQVTKMICSPMPIIPKRGCLNTARYILVITELKDLQRVGDFVAHEQMVHKQIAFAVDPDMQASLQIERAMALYFQNKIKDAKIILKIVLKQEPNLKNPGILGGRALNLLTAIYKREGKYGHAMTCVERARTYLEDQDSPNDKAELHHSYGALITSMPAAKNPKTSRATKEEAYNTYEMAGHCTTIERFNEYVHVKMAALLLDSCANAVKTVTDRFPCKEDVIKAKKHLDLVEFREAADHKMPLGTRIKLLILRSDQYRCEENVATALKKAQEASDLVDQHCFKLEFDSAKKRIDILAAMLRQENEEWLNSELRSSNGYIADSESANSE